MSKGPFTERSKKIEISNPTLIHNNRLSLYGICYFLIDNKIQGLDDIQLLRYTHDIVEPLLQNNQRFIILYVFENFSM